MCMCAGVGERGRGILNHFPENVSMRKDPKALRE